MDFKLLYDKRKKYIDSLVEHYGSRFNSPSKVLLDSVSYSLLSGGKRLRAILALELFEHFGGKVDESFEIFLASLELLHLYTLVHDDLPCMDNDDFRRGKKSNHKVFGEGMALLCGDSLLNYSYELLFYAVSLAKDKARFITASVAYSTFTGGSGVIGGQALEFEDNRILDLAHVLEIYRHKTCDLIIGALVFGAILAGASTSQIETVKEFGYHFGIAFQIRDDFLDKDKGESENNSLLGLIGEEVANNMLKESGKRALDCLNDLGIKSQFLKELVSFAVLRLT